jgi:hypothetical protein
MAIAGQSIAAPSTGEVREIASFECAICSQTMESWNTTWVPLNRLVAGAAGPDQTA